MIPRCRVTAEPHSGKIGATGVITTSGDIRDSVIRAAMADMVNAVTALRQSGQADLCQALKNLTDRLLGCEILPQIRQEILENLVFVAQQAQMQPERRKRGVVKAALAFVKSTMQAVETLSDAWRTYGRNLENFFNL